MNELGEAEANYLRAKLQKFITLNPEADVESRERETSIVRPWGEEAIEIPLRSDDEELFQALNSIRLPPRFTAIWHEDTRELEVIYTVVRRDNPLLERRFEFRYKAHCYRCEFGPSSPRLRIVARRARPSGRWSSTDFRNLQPFYRFEHMLEEHPDTDFARNSKPTSFWIRGFDEYNDDHIGDFVRNLNFYMAFFDSHTPTILVHEESSRPRTIDVADSLERDGFPESISGKEIDQHLLILWASARGGDPFLGFIQYYQILEYAGFYHVKDRIRRELERAIAAPDATSHPERVAQQMLDAISADKRHDNDKINSVIEECVDLEGMWRLLDGSLNDFTEDVELDGGFVLPALIGDGASHEEFLQEWNRKFPNALHQIRNALVHARETRQFTTIAPTISNQERLSPWLLPLSLTAARVMLYSRI